MTPEPETEEVTWEDPVFGDATFDDAFDASDLEGDDDG